MTRSATPAFRAILLLASILFAAGLAEGALRVWYRDAGRRTLGGPGGHPFEHDTIDGELRGRRDIGAKTPGVPRIMVVGDSITYGLGIKDWHLAWPELLTRQLAENGHPHEMAVFAFPGQDIDQHVNVMREWADRVAADVFIYQWYVNDIEAMEHRPDLTRAWQRAPWHDWLQRWSYLYFVANYRLSQLLPPPTRSYVDYLLADFAPGTMEWAEFERQFNEFATRAAHASSRRIMALYPQVPFRGDYPLRPLHEHMRALAGAHDLEIPPAAWSRAGGTLAPDATAPRKQVFSAADGAEAVVETNEYLFPAGGLTVDVLLRAATEAANAIVTLEVVDAASGSVLARGDVRALSLQLTPVRVSLSLPGEGLQPVRLRVRSSRQPAWSLGNIRVPVDYGFEVVDLADTLNTFPTHASAFDAHPNEAAQRAMAEALYNVVVRTPAR